MTHENVDVGAPSTCTKYVTDCLCTSNTIVCGLSQISKLLKNKLEVKHLMGEFQGNQLGPIELLLSSRLWKLERGVKFQPNSLPRRPTSRGRRVSVYLLPQKFLYEWILFGQW